MHAARGLRRYLPAVAIAVALLAAPASALADCQMAPPFEEAAKTAEIVFVGTVTGLANEGRVATVQVDEVWRGGEMPAEVTVFGGTDPAGPMEDDRTFEASVRYVFFPFVAEGRMVDNICTATTPWIEDFAALRPAGAQTPAPSAAPAAAGPLAAIADLALPILTALLIGGAALAVAIIVGRRREA
ncbi:MAG TPA: hypothetical protein VFX65_04255 [Candidatus Limnocylindrales bacterium]|nr:hypothetical protein [Candidatus Limnocylindrales bacterium]